MNGLPLQGFYARPRPAVPVTAWRYIAIARFPKFLIFPLSGDGGIVRARPRNFGLGRAALLFRSQMARPQKSVEEHDLQGSAQRQPPKNGSEIEAGRAGSRRPLTAPKERSLINIMPS